MLAALVFAALAGQIPQQGVLSDLARTPAPAAETVDPGEYVLGPGDLLWVASEGGLPSEFSAGSAVGSVFFTAVTIDGNVLLPMVGSVNVDGLTLAEGAALIERRMRSGIVGCRPSAGLSVARTTMVVVTGAVASPGAVPVRGTDRLSDAIQAAGGPVPGAALSRVMLIGSGGDTVRVDLFRFLTDGDPSCNPLLAPGQRVYLPAADEVVSVQGAVRDRWLLSSVFSEASGPAEGASVLLEYIPGETPEHAVTRAGGFAPWALRDSCYVVRPLAGGGEVLLSASEASAVRPGDRVVVPGTPVTIAVTGYVRSPGTYPFVAGRGISYYIAQAGGFSPEARASGTSVLLPGGSEADPESLSDIPAGSVIQVPRKALVWWQDYFTILTGIASIVIAWHSL